MRLLLDEMYPPMLADVLCDKGHDVIAVAALAEFVGSDDATILEVASVQGRCLVTENVRDFTALVRDTSHAGGPRHPPRVARNDSRREWVVAITAVGS